MGENSKKLCVRLVVQLVLLISVGAMPLTVFGVEPKVGAPPTTTGPIEDPQGFIDLVAAIVRWVGIAFWIVAVGFVFFAAYIYLTAGGDPEKIRKAHKQLLWAVVAIAVALMAAGLPVFIKAFLESR